MYEPSKEDPETEHLQEQLIKLHSVVGRSIMKHKILPASHSQFAAFALPTKKGRFDWSLGTGAASFRKNTKADYGLFVNIRDSYASGGRVALMTVVALATMGRAIPLGGSQAGFASLVDLKTGDIVWFNRLFSAAGDLRTPENARAAVKELLADLPL